MNTPYTKCKNSHLNEAEIVAIVSSACPNNTNLSHPSSLNHSPSLEHLPLKMISSLYAPNNNNLRVKDMKFNPPEWDMFRLLPPKSEGIGNGLLVNYFHFLITKIIGFWHYFFLQVLKISSFFVLFFLTLGSAVVAKSTFLLMISGINSAEKNVSICTDKIPGIYRMFNKFPLRSF